MKELTLEKAKEFGKLFNPKDSGIERYYFNIYQLSQFLEVDKKVLSAKGKIYFEDDTLYLNKLGDFQKVEDLELYSNISRK